LVLLLVVVTTKKRYPVTRSALLLQKDSGGKVKVPLLSRSEDCWKRGFLFGKQCGKLQNSHDAALVA
jgi:hypothetical protein